MFSDFDKKIKVLVEKDEKSQRVFLQAIADIRYLDIDYFLSKGCFFVPNQEYMREYLGISSMNETYDIYNYDGECKWLWHLVFPIRNAVGELVGFAGYNPLSKMILKNNQMTGENEIVPPKYIYSSKSVFDRGNYLFIPNGYTKCVEDGYAIIVDGMFDSMTIGSLGYNAVGMLGSKVSDKLLFMLSFVKTIYVIHDNDEAGLNLYKLLNKNLHNVVDVRVPRYKDVDSYVYNEGAGKFKNVMDKVLESGSLLPVNL